jgi:hypothetical protein
LEMNKMMSLDLFCYKIVVIVSKKRGYKNGWKIKAIIPTTTW